MDKSLNTFLQTTYRERELVNLMWMGFILYTLSYTLTTTTYINPVICQVLQLMGLLVFIPSFFTLAKFRISNTYLSIVFTLYMLWVAYIVVRGLPTNGEEIKFMIFDAWFGGILYLSPLFLLLPPKLYYLKKLFQSIFILAIAFLFYDVFFLRDLLSQGESLTSMYIIEYFSKTLAVPAFFLLMAFRYHTNQKKFFLIIILLVTIFFALYRARRGLLFMCGLSAMISYILYLSQTKNRYFIVILTIVVGGILVVLGMEFFTSSRSGIFEYITDRGLEDTRSSVELCLYQDLTSKEWIIGKGMNGEYYCPGIDPDDVTGYRKTIETDYLQLVLKGGLVSVFIFLLITIPAIIKGLFFSKNLLTKAAACWILYILINMYPATINTFTLQYILLWIAVAICFTPFLRNMEEEDLTNYLRN